MLLIDTKKSYFWLMSVESLQKEILALSKSEQEHLILFLSNTLENNKDVFLDKEQLSEINKRLLELEDGKVKGVDSTTAMTKLYAKYKA